MTIILAPVICDSIGQHSPRLHTQRWTHPKFNHQEALRHRKIYLRDMLEYHGLPPDSFALTDPNEQDFSLSVSSSRAIPFKRKLAEVRDDATRASPISWGAEQRGMSPGDEVDDITAGVSWHEVVKQIHGLDDTGLINPGNYYGGDLPDKITKREVCRRLWRLGLLVQSAFAEVMADVTGCHKTFPNRMIEHGTHVDCLATATYDGWMNWFGLRLDKAADPTLRTLAEASWVSWNESTPKVLRPGEWHLPYIEDDDWLSACFHHHFDEHGHFSLLLENRWASDKLVETVRKISVARCAHLSYESFENPGQRMSIEKCIELHDRFVNSRPLHCYDAQTEVFTEIGFVSWSIAIEKDLKLANVDSGTGRFTGFVKPISVVAGNYDGPMYCYDGSDLSLWVTPNHRLYAHRIKKLSDRQGFDPQLFKASTPNSDKASYSTAGESAMKMATSCAGTDGEYNPVISGRAGPDFLAFCGFFVGDGYANPDFLGPNKVSFHLRRERKVRYLINVLDRLGLEYTDSWETITVKCDGMCREFRRMFYNSDGEKTFPTEFFNLPENLILGFLEGLLNSDGSHRRKTWVYSTTSLELVDRLVALGTVYGQPFTVTKTMNEPPRKPGYRLNAGSRPYVLVNDPRKNRVSIARYTGRVYCAEVDGGVLVVRRNGKVVLSGNSSPMEHQATPDYLQEHVSGAVWTSRWQHPEQAGNLAPGWRQYRKMIPGEAVAALPTRHTQQ